LKAFLKKYWLLFTVALIMVALDQWTKYLVRTNIPFGDSWMPWQWLAPYARIVHWTNNGVAFGMFQGKGMIFAALALIVSGAIIYYYPQIPEKEWLMRMALGLQLAGALGNLIDRILFNFEVTDFISVGNFAVFNIADASITVGVALLLIVVWVKDARSKKDDIHIPEPEEDSQTEELVDESQNCDD
jgi:signal peptidase II